MDNQRKAKFNMPQPEDNVRLDSEPVYTLEDILNGFTDGDNGPCIDRVDKRVLLAILLERQMGTFNRRIIMEHATSAGSGPS